MASDSQVPYRVVVRSRSPRWPVTSRQPFSPGSWSEADFEAVGMLEPITRIVRNCGHDLGDTFGTRARGEEGRTARLARNSAWRWLESLGWSYCEIARAWGIDHQSVSRQIGPARERWLSRRRVAS